MAPSQRGLGVTMKRGWKGRTAGMNSTGVHLNIEHVISCERQQLASEVPLRKTVGLVEAPLGSAWTTALYMADCKQLMKLLKENPCRVVQKDTGGFTVLHAAAMRGCLQLLDQVFDLFQGEREPTDMHAIYIDGCWELGNQDFDVIQDMDWRFVDEREGIELSLEELCKAESSYGRKEKIGTAGLTAAEFAWWSMGDCDARRYLDVGRRFDSGPFSSYQSEIFGSWMALEGADAEYPPPWLLLLDVLAHHENLCSNGIEKHMEYNFLADCEELRFHHACQHLYYEGGVVKKYVEAVIGGCVEKGPHMLKYLFQLRNAQGQTPLHVALKSGSLGDLVGLIPGRESGENAECLNMRDSREWTALHCCVFFEGLSNELDVLLEDGRAEVNARVSRRREECPRATPLHLAVLHNRSKAVERLLQDIRTDVNAHFHRQLYFDDSLYVSRFHMPLKEWTTLQLAVVAGLPQIMKVLLRCPRVVDFGKLQHDCGKFDSRLRSQNISAIHLAAASGDTETLLLFITNRPFDLFVTCYGATPLHFVVASRRPTLLQSLDDKPPYISNRILTMEDFYSMASYLEAIRKGAKDASYEGREGCISILVHAGVDVWKKDLGGNFPEHGSSASSANHLSWQKMVANETRGVHWRKT